MQYTVLSDSSFKGKVVSEVQGTLIGALTVMPDASARMRGCVIKYIGEATSEYTKYEEYICIESGGVYEWICAGQAANKQNKVTISTSAPTASDGAHGDMWVQV